MTFACDVGFPRKIPYRSRIQRWRQQHESHFAFGNKMTPVHLSYDPCTNTKQQFWNCQEEHAIEEATRNVFIVDQLLSRLQDADMVTFYGCRTDGVRYEKKVQNTSLKCNDEKRKNGAKMPTAQTHRLSKHDGTKFQFQLISHKALLSTLNKAKRKYSRLSFYLSEI